MTPEEQAAADRGTAAANSAFGNPTTPAAEVKTEEPAEPAGEMKKLIALRDRFKRERNLLAKSLGLNPADLKLVPTSDAAEPYRLEAPGLQEVINAAAGREQLSEKERQLKAEHSKTTSAYEAYINRQSVDLQLRSALVAEGAIDPLGTGEYEDIIPILRAKLVASRSFDEAGQLSVTVAAVGADGEPVEGTGAKEVVSEFLSKRPALKATQRRSGPGAGGYGNGTAGKGSTPIAPATRGDQAADYFFGAAPSRNAGDYAFGNGRRPPGSPIRR